MFACIQKFTDGKQWLKRLNVIHGTGVTFHKNYDGYCIVQKGEKQHREGQKYCVYFLIKVFFLIIVDPIGQSKVK